MLWAADLTDAAVEDHFGLHGNHSGSGGQFEASSSRAGSCQATTKDQHLQELCAAGWDNDRLSHVLLGSLDFSVPSAMVCRQHC